MLRIYISSTYEDLIEERRAVRDAVHGLRHHAVGMEDYAASDERPLDRCLEDVRNCDAYVGIFAWRYGFRPSGGEKSITQLEYEAAKALNKPRYLFLLDAKAPWPTIHVDTDRQRIETLREVLLLDRLAGFFHDASSLARIVIQSFANAGIQSLSSPPIPGMIPYLCDRGDQEIALKDAVKQLREKPDHPLVCIIDGEDTEQHDKFRERLQKVMLPLLLPQEALQSSVRFHLLEWPASFRNVEEMHHRFEMSLSKQILATALGDCKTVNRALAQSPGPVGIHSHLITENWQQEHNGIDAFVDFWRKWPQLMVGQLLFVFLFIKYKKHQGDKSITTRRMLQYRRLNLQMRAALHKYDPLRPEYSPNLFERLTVKVVPELRGPTLGEAEDWARSSEVGRFCDSQALVAAITDYYAEWEAQHKATAIQVRIPTDELIPELQDMMSRFPRTRLDEKIG